jgi:hypothetical protein
MLDESIQKRNDTMKSKIVVLALAALLIPSVCLAWGDDSEYGSGEWEESVYQEPEFQSMPLDAVWDIIIEECAPTEEHGENCPEEEHDLPTPPEHGQKDFECALSVLEELLDDGELCHDVYLSVKHQIQVEMAFSHGFEEGFKKGSEGASCQPPEEGGENGGEGGESEGGSESEQGGSEGGEGQPQEKVVICHIPPGNPANAHTLEVGAPAVQAHLNHGDVPGSCEDDAGAKKKGKKEKKGKKGKKKRGKKKR